MPLVIGGPIKDSPKPVNYKPDPKSKIPAPDEQQVFKAWDRLMHEMGVTAPKQLNRATFFRARLDDVVK